MGSIIQRIESQSGIENLSSLLGDRLPPSDLQSLLMRVYQFRIKKIDASRLMQMYLKHPMVQPTTSDPVKSLKLDQLAYSKTPADFQPLELSPVTPLGSCSALAAVDQNRIVSTIRNSEVVADATNTLALECARRRKKYLGASPKSCQPVKLCASHRLLRTQPVTDHRFTAHFRIFCLCSAGRDEGSYRFEAKSLLEHISVYLSLLQSCYPKSRDFNAVQVLITDLKRDGTERIKKKVMEPLGEKFPDFHIASNPDRTTAVHYYQDACFYIRIKDENGIPYDVADGGFTDWTQQLLQNRKERLLTSGIGTELLQRILPLEIK